MLFEAFLCGCLGTLSGLILGTLLLKAMSYLIEAMGVPSQVMTFSTADYLFVLVSGIMLSLISAILPAISIAKENIVTGLRYE
jgi:ABC-type antimicrobial peptide transport system permease subunit